MSGRSLQISFVIFTILAAGAAWIMLRDDSGSRGPRSGLSESNAARTAESRESPVRAPDGFRRVARASSREITASSRLEGRGAPAEPAFVEGMVVDAATREPISAASILVRDLETTLQSRGETDRTGAFLVEAPAGSSAVRIGALAGGYAPDWVEDVGLRGGQARDVGVIALERGRPLSGRVLRKNGTPVSGAQVTLLRTSSMRSFCDLDIFKLTREVFASDRAIDVATSSAEGAFAFAAVGRGEYVLVGHAPGFEVAFSRPLTVVREGPAVSVEIVLAPGRTLEGKVVTEDGTPIAGAIIAVFDEPRVVPFTLKAQKVRSDAGGSFVLTTLGDDEYEILARAEGFVPAGVDHYRVGERPLEMVLKRGASISGRISDVSTGDPISGAEVAAMGKGPGGQFAPARTDANGAFFIAGAPAGPQNHLTIKLPGWSVVRTGGKEPVNAFEQMLNWVELPEIKPGAEHRVDIKMARGGRILGQVVDAESGAPVAGAEVCALPGTAIGFMGRSAGAPHARSGDEGAFVLATVEPGRFRLIAWKEGYVMQQEAAAQALGRSKNAWEEAPVLAPGADVQGQIVRLARGATLECRTVTPDDRGIEGASINWTDADGLFATSVFMVDSRQRTVTSGPQGHATLTGLPRLTDLRLVVTHPDFKAGCIAIVDTTQPPQEPIKLVLERGATVRGTIVRPDGRAAARVRLAFEIEAEERPGGLFMPERRDRVSSDEDGGFVFEGLGGARGRIKLLDRLDANLTTIQQSEPTWPVVLDPTEARVELRADRPAEVHLRLHVPLAISGRVLGPDGLPAKEAIVSARRDVTGDEMHGAYDGAIYRIEQVPPGQYTVTVLGTVTDPREGSEPVRVRPFSLTLPSVDAGTSTADVLVK